MRISARNVLKGTITDVEIGAVSGVVSIKVGETALTSIITMEAIHDLGLKKGMTAYAVIKASHAGACPSRSQTAISSPARSSTT